ncbi:MAG: glycosyltransferase family 2 protein [Candidatus Brocadiales bacterium]
MSDLKVSVIAPTYNRSSIIPRFLAALDCQTVLPEDYEVILVDDGSTDETREVVSSFAGKLKFNLEYLYQPNGGPASARNLGIQKARGRLILILNDDAIVNQNLIEKHLATHEQLLPRKAAVLGSFDWDEELISNPFMRYISQNSVIFQYPRMVKGFYNYKYFWTCNISITRELLLKAGLFDEIFTDPMYEDIELGYRLQKMGVDVYFDPTIVSTHHHIVTLKSFVKRSHCEGVNLTKMATKYPELTRKEGRFLLPGKLRKSAGFIQNNKEKYEEAIRYLEHIEKLRLLQYDELKAADIKEGSGSNHDTQLKDSIDLVHKYEKRKAILEEVTKNDITLTLATYIKANYYLYIVKNITRPLQRLLRRFNIKKID